jgi:hypothetical protein
MVGEQPWREQRPGGHFDLDNIPPAVAHHKLEFELLHPAAVDPERFGSSQEETLTLTIASATEIEFMGANPDAWTQFRRRETNLLVQLSEGCFLMRLTGSESAAWRDPDGTGRVACLNQLEKNSAGRVEKDDACGVSVNQASSHAPQSLTRAIERPSRIGTTTLSSCGCVETSRL